MLLKEVIPAGRPTLIFASTRHHVDLLAQLLTSEGISATYVYGTLDQVMLTSQPRTSDPGFTCEVSRPCRHSSFLRTPPQQRHDTWMHGVAVIVPSRLGFIPVVGRNE